MSDLIYILIVGGVAGWLAGIFMKSKGFGIILNIIVGIVGGWLGSWLFATLGLDFSLGNKVLTDIVVALIGAVVLLFILRLINK